MQTAFLPHLPEGPFIASHSLISNKVKLKFIYKTKASTRDVAYLDSFRKHSLTDTSGRYVIWIEGPSVLADAISLVTVGLTECMLAARHLVTWRFETMKIMCDEFLSPNCNILFSLKCKCHCKGNDYLCTLCEAECRRIRTRTRNGSFLSYSCRLTRVRRDSSDTRPGRRTQRRRL